MGRPTIAAIALELLGGQLPAAEVCVIEQCEGDDQRVAKLVAEAERKPSALVVVIKSYRQGGGLQ
jgi:hypothetical protein